LIIRANFIGVNGDTTPASLNQNWCTTWSVIVNFSLLSRFLHNLRSLFIGTGKQVTSWIALSLVALIGISASLLLHNPSVEAADKILLDYAGIKQINMTFTELQAFADKGQTTPVIDQILQIANQKPADGQKFLTEPMSITPTSMTSLVNSYVGGVILAELGQVILPASGTEKPVALLKEALVKAVENNQVTVLNVIKSYPVDMKLNGQKFLEIQNQVEKDKKVYPEIMAGVQSLLPKLVPGFTLAKDCPGAAPLVPSTTATPAPTRTLPAQTTPAPAASPTVAPSPTPAPAATPAPTPGGSQRPW
jgi:hypothetical protein